eukprot:TRINITY_DN4315_c1_g6_i1.p1 TRINITY_DN4315_c1_g6~~TRINITY_DN4315_c1_g6_i1.p1  ORF type:complete len:962 (+),score=344.87 TRINITY_DN4315_c1_g6_i1:684-3569(+)
MAGFQLAPATLHELVERKDHELLARLGGVEGVAAQLRTNLDAGIDGDTAAARVDMYGQNVLPPAQRQTLLDFVKEALNDKTMLILIGAACLSLLLGMTTPNPDTGKVDYSTGWIEGAAILMSVAIVVVVTAANDFKKQEKFAELETSSTEYRTVIVVRGGAKASVPHASVVVGDVLFLEPGFHFTMDCVYIRGDALVADERNLTGESDEVPKGGGDPFFISGTDLLEGVGYALVVGVGEHSVQGHIAVATRAEKKQTPLEEKLEDLAEKIGYFGMAAAGVTFAVLTCKETYHLWFTPGAAFSFMKYWEMLTAAVAIVVVAVPEGLPLSVTIALAYSMQQMLADKNLVRHLAACETMGGATCICSDKTGTLTSNCMRVTQLWVAGRAHVVAKPGSDDWQRLATGHEAFSFAVTAADRVELDADKATAKLMRRALYYSSLDENNRTAIALILLLRRLGFDARQDGAVGAHVERRPFSSVTKQSQALVDEPGSGRHLYTKGASELILAKCAKFINSDGAPEPFAPQTRRAVEQQLHAFASGGLRTLALAYSAPHAAGAAAFEAVDMTLVALVGIEEPIRPEVAYAVRQCQSAGINVKMVTGDNKVSAMAVARECGIYAESEGLVAMDGHEFREMTDDAARAAVRSLAVLARATPLDKQRLVELIKNERDEVVAVTGDGTNDGPALKTADVGFAMNSGTDVAKSASDIVLTDDNFTGVVKAVMWGRNVNDNIRKFLQFQLTVNSAACATAVCGSFLSETNLSPLKPVQLLWLNLIMDSLAALGLATQLPSEALLTRAPQPKSSSIISRNMWFFIAGHGAYQFCVCLFLLTSGDNWIGVPSFSDEHLSFLFNTFVLMQIANFFNARALSTEMNVFKELHRSKILLAIAAIIFVLQVLIVNYGGKFFGTVPLPRHLWEKSILLSAGSLPAGVAIKAFQRRRGWKTLGLSPTARRPHGPRFEDIRHLL